MAKHAAKKKKRNFNPLFLIIQLIVSVVTAFLFRNILPVKYWLVLVTGLVFLLLVSGLLLKNRKKKTRVVLGRIFTVIVSLGLFLLAFFTSRGLDTLGAITGGRYQIQVINVVVRQDSSYEKLSDLEGQSLGYIPQLDGQNNQKALDNISGKEKVSCDLYEYSSLDELWWAVSNGEIESMMVNSSYMGLISEYDESFSDNSRIIYQYHILQKLKGNHRHVKVNKESFNVFISGIDTYGPVSAVSRSDVNMIVTVNPKTRQLLLTSIPRDYYVELADFNAMDKLTHAGIYGVDESAATLENLFNISVDFYARVNFTSLVTMVDALGGITVENPQEFSSGGYYFPAGNIELDGQSALAFVRERKQLSGGDRSRVMNQQRVLMGMLNKIMSPEIIKNYYDVLSVISGCFETSMSSSDIQKLIQMQLNDMSSWQIEQQAVDGYGSTSTSCYSMPGWELYVMEPDWETVNAASARIDEVMKQR